MTDALDKHTWYHVTGKPAPHEVLWAAWLAMWDRIGKDCGFDFLLWAAWGDAIADSRGPHCWPEPSEKLRDEARALYLKCGGTPPEGTP